MSYLVFARKWRPQDFDEISGQEHIGTTLKNAISLNRVAHAYLFSGPRGIGKTSTARILAKALNCRKGPAPKPCNVCETCREISDGRSLDVIEIDGASNRGIEQIRRLRENVKFAPAKSRFKIYIIDEVHQITTDGFNALLKTLEEPPAHIKFIFATTQAYKVLPTILSRCQRFDFKLLSTATVAEKLKRIVKTEKLDITGEALLYIARSAAGSMRDAESMLDQLSSFTREKINLEMAASILGTIGHQVLSEVCQKIIEKDTIEAFNLVEKIINDGRDPVQFVAGLMEHFRNILVAKITDSENAQKFIDLPGDDISRIFEQAKLMTFEEIFYIFNVLVRTQESLKRSLSSRVVLEVAVVRLAQRENLSSLQDLFSKFTKLEESLNELDVPLADNPGTSHIEAQTPENPAAIAQSPAPAVQSPAAITQSPAPAVQSPAAEDLASDEDLNGRWANLLEIVKEEKMFLASYLEFAKVSGLKGGVLTLAFAKQYNFYKESLEDAENKKFIEAKAKEVFGRDIKLKFVLDKNLEAQISGPNQESEAPQKKTPADGIVQSALKIFQGRIIRRSGE